MGETPQIQSLGYEMEPSEMSSSSQRKNNFSIGFTDLNADERLRSVHYLGKRNYTKGLSSASSCFVVHYFQESLNALEDHDLDALMADLGSDLSETEEKLNATKTGHVHTQQHKSGYSTQQQNVQAPISLSQMSSLASSSSSLPPEPPKPLPPGEAEAQARTDKIKLALEKLKEAKVKKLVVKVMMSDGSSKTLMVDERQTVRDVLDNLFEKTHCDFSMDWSLCETNPELQTERGFEDHEYLVEPLSAWTRDSKNQIIFLLRPNKYLFFKDPQIFYLWKKDQKCINEIKERHKELLRKENFDGPSLIVPDLEGLLYLREDGKKSWKRRYFLLRASGIYYVPKGKTKTSRDLACFIQLDKVNIYSTTDYKQKYKAPSDFCFILKHPQIQKESQYIRFLCCDDEHTLSLWVNSIRVAKYGATLYKNYQMAVRRASTISSTLHLTSLPASSPSTPTVHRANGHTPQEDLPEPPPDFIPPPPPGWGSGV
ncbi:amyloid beta A4 precursor protein-binding family B member 1-interacting protein-like isoform X2 [Oncorhynchus keta]|uniref:amyloid beta A4 precursor protein-binding family B member 1-interacting protein-like isoform X2 n=1 Tax=Oncorhynchus keta TaxID=8018 RepID=UPI00227D603E|nr:amyloid beta A4 precursor protein-binding family B member 1-interacting protein-like isoform X2 [Oncorhynchus keta]